MRLRFLIETAVGGLTANKPRAFLTILGIVIGITAIMVVMGVGRGAQNLIVGEIQGIGARLLAVLPGRQPRGPTDIIATFTDSLKQRDLDAILREENVPHLADVMPIVFGSETTAYEGETYRPTIFGVTELFSEIYNIYPAEGRNMTEEEVRASADVVIVGSKVAEELAQGGGLLGERVKIKGRNFLVIGIIAPKGGSSFINFDEVAIVPYTTAQRYIFGIKHFHRIAIRADTEENVPRTVRDVQETLRMTHNITDPAKDDFYVETSAEAMEIVGTITNALTLFLAAVAAVSLLVGGVGIMNIMLVSVTERTHEIGLRKAVGGTDRDILLQFLLEAIMLTLIGGAIGVALGSALSLAASIVLSRTLGADWPFAFPLNAALLGLGVAAAVGLIFGLYPARKASRKSPIEALRYE